MNNTKKSLIWITYILNKYKIPFQITGGLAAISYGANRELADIDIDIPDNQITQIGIESIIDFYRTMAIDEYSSSGVNAFVTGAHSTFLNVLFDLRHDKSNSADLIEKAEIFFNKYQLPWGWFVVPAMNNDLLSQKLKFIQESPAMYFDLTHALPEIESTHIEIKSVQNIKDLEEWITPINDGFEIEEDDNSFFELNSRLLKEDKNTLQHFVAYYKAKAGASGTLFISKNAVMIHNIATAKNFRNLGLATALTLHMMQKAKHLGFKHCYLDSSEEAFKLYKRIGFKVYCTTLIYNKK